MLFLTRYEGEADYVLTPNGDVIKFEIVSKKPDGSVVVGFDAPRKYRIMSKKRLIEAGYLTDEERQPAFNDTKKFPSDY